MIYRCPPGSTTLRYRLENSAGCSSDTAGDSRRGRAGPSLIKRHLTCALDVGRGASNSVDDPQRAKRSTQRECSYD